MGGILKRFSKLPLAGKVVSVVIALAVIGGVGNALGLSGGSGGDNGQSSESTVAVSQADKAESSDAQSSGEATEQAPEPEPEPEPVTGTMRVHFIDVGQGDSEFVEMPDGTTMLIDAGEESEGGTVVGYIQSLGYTSIDRVVATHPHADHIGGMPAVLSAFDVGEVWAPNVTHDTQTFEAFLDAVAAKGLKINTASAGKSIVSEPGLSAEVLSSSDGAGYSDLNDWSAIVRLTFGDSVFLFTGDAGSGVIASSGAGDVDVLKVGHHGSDTSTDSALVSALAPEYAVISCGAGNSYGHPHQATLDALAGVQLYRTDTDGTVVAACDGSSVSFEKNVTAPRAQVEQPADPQPDNVSQAPAANDDVGGGITVYITKTGEKYHLDGCGSLSKSKIPISLEDAKARGYEPCKRCNPPA